MIRRIVLIIVTIIPLSLHGQVGPPTFSIDGKDLERKKRRVSQGDEVYVKALERLVSEANQLLMHGPYSVTFKGDPVGGASIHDYVSLSTYYWPDSSKSDGLPYIRKDGEIFKEREKISDYQMMNTMADNVLVLGMAYFYTCDERYVRHAKYLLEVFFLEEETKMNPHFESSQIILGRKNSGGATISATSLISVVEGVQLISASKHWKTRDHKRLQNWFTEFLDWMLNSEKGRRQASSPNNIGTYYTLQTTVYALFVDRIDLARVIIQDQAFLRINTQIDKSGAMPLELRRANPWSYVTFNLTAFDKLVVVAKKVDVNLLDYENEEGGSIEKAFRWLLPFQTEKKKWEYSKESVSPSSINQVFARTRSLSIKQSLNDNVLKYPLYYRYLLF